MQNKSKNVALHVIVEYFWVSVLVSVTMTHYILPTFSSVIYRMVIFVALEYRRVNAILMIDNYIDHN